MAYISFQPSDYFNTQLYTGTGSTNAQTGVGFQPDWTWIKNRSANDGHHIYDVVRGVTKRIRSDTTAAEATTAQGLTAFGTDGFTVGTEEDVNTNSENFISWNWKAGNSAGSSNSDGSITSTVSANTTSGFSIVKWTGTGSDGTVGHGLGAVPEMAIIKSLGNTTYWMVYHKRLGNAAEIYLNADNAENTGAARPKAILSSFSPANSGSKSPVTVVSPSGSPAATGSELNVTPIAIASPNTKITAPAMIKFLFN